MKYEWSRLRTEAVLYTQLIKHYAWRYMGEWRYSSSILDLGNSWRWVVCFMPRPFCPDERSPDSTHFIGGWVGPTAGLSIVKKRQISCLCQEPTVYDICYTSNEIRLFRPIGIYIYIYTYTYINTQSENNWKQTFRVISRYWPCIPGSSNRKIRNQ
jgi:hypothetical protein